MENNQKSQRDQPPASILRVMNRENLIGLLSRHGPMTRGQMAERAGLTPAAISRISREMIEAGVLLEGAPLKAHGRVGRRESLLSINPEGAYVLAISLTANRRSICLADAVGEIVHAVPCEDLDLDDPHTFLETMASRAKHLVYEADFNRRRLVGVGVSAAVSASAQGNDIEDAITSNPLGWRDVPVRDTLSKALNLPVKVEHRASAILRAELRRGKVEGDVFLINAAMGLGVSARLDGRFMTTGSAGFGSLSHFSIPEDRVPCVCGRTGCLEVTAAGGAILKSLEMGDCSLPQQAQRLNDAVVAAESGDPQAREAFWKAGRKLSVGVDAVLSLLRPSKIFLSGEVGRQSDYLAGLLDGLKARACPLPENGIQPTSIKSNEAAISVALQEYVFTGALKAEHLRAA